ncbi:hypothetical protein V7122_14180 [Bacillus sp. JJ1532]|uniref:hypothetical protein n=1 Tax=Bacillus sp. JJ1532 TaxID=3122958 RepID=UPI002FFD87AA
MKKKAIKLATSTAIAASAFVAAAPANQADAAVNVDQLVKDAENAAGALKWAISVEGTADGKTAPHALYNLTKDTNKAAQAAVAKASGAQKVLYTARLQAVELQISRAMAYIDGITAGKKIEGDTATLNAAIAAKDLDKVEDAYHKMTKEYRKQAALLDRVYGQSTRDVIRNATKKPAEAAIEAVKVDVTVKMHLDAADKAIKANDLKAAGESLEKAQAWLDKVSATFKAELTKSSEDVVNALPLKVSSVSALDKTTVEVKFTKAVDVASVSHFAFDNNLSVSSVVLSTDKKVATLKTTTQVEGKTYTLSYKGENTGKNFTVGKSAADDKLTVDATDVARFDKGTSRLYVVTLKNPDGSVFKGKAKVDLQKLTSALKANGVTTDAGTAILQSVNGVTGVASTNGFNANITTWEGLVNDGKLNIIVANASLANTTSVGVAPVITMNSKADNVFDADDKSVEGGAVIFLEQAANATNNLFTDIDVKYVNKDANFFTATTTGGTVEVKYNYDSNDIYQVNGNAVTEADFESKLSKADRIDVNYQNNAKNGQSIFNITVDHNTADLTVTTPSKGTLRVTNSYYTLVGTAQPGYTVHVYRNNGNNAVHDSGEQLIGKVVADSNGNWSLGVNLDTNQLNDFVVVQEITGVTVANGKAGVQVKLQHGNYIITGAVFADTNTNGSVDLGEVATITTTSGDTVKIADGASITVKDFDGTYATFTNGVNNTKIEKDSTNGNIFRITFGSANGSISGGDGKLTGNLIIDSVTGITNQDNIVLNIKDSTDAVINN